MDTHSTPQLVVALADRDDPADVIDMLTLAPFVAGSQPASRAVRLVRVRPDASLLPSGATILRTARSAHGHGSVLAAGDGWTMRSARWPGAVAVVTVVAETDELAESVLRQATADACEPDADDGGVVPMRFWHRGFRGPVMTARGVAVPRWDESRVNYTSVAASALGRLHGLGPDQLPGRLVLLHGPPGTGKTTALRTLADAWRGWCTVESVLDPERLYGDAGYLMHVLLEGDCDADDGAATSERWRLLILEDCDELLRADAKRHTGQALARLLNVTDGLIGQGTNLLVALTTNERLAELHPAVVRPGRCLAEIHVGPLSRPEAEAWLGTRQGIGPDGATLAELYALRGDTGAVRAPELRAVSGTYL